MRAVPDPALRLYAGFGRLILGESPTFLDRLPPLAECVRKHNQHMLGHLLLHSFDFGLLFRLVPDQGTDAVLSEADVTPPTGDRSTEDIGSPKPQRRCSRAITKQVANGVPQLAPA